MRRIHPLLWRRLCTLIALKVEPEQGEGGGGCSAEVNFLPSCHQGLSCFLCNWCTSCFSILHSSSSCLPKRMLIN